MASGQTGASRHSLFMHSTTDQELILMKTLSLPSQRPILGLRARPGRLALALFRMPLRAYAHNAGWVLGHVFLEFTHFGRKTGQPHRAVAMVLNYNEATGEAVICAGWGSATDWYRNLQAYPTAQVRISRESFTAHTRFLTENEAFEVCVNFRETHPYRVRLIARILGWGDLRNDIRVREFVRQHPFVAFEPTDIQPAKTA